MHSNPGDSGFLEIEVKFWVKDIPHMRETILACGATPRGKTFENNIRFDDLDASLKKKRLLLRLRQESNGVNTLTVKSPPQTDDTRFKVFTEREVTVSNAEVMAAMLTELGYQPVQRYEKWRETFDLNRTRLCLDQMPFGDFLEIEGERDEIKRAAEVLGLDWESRITSNYLALFERIRQKMSLSFIDVTFENFQRIGYGADSLPVSSAWWHDQTI